MRGLSGRYSPCQDKCELLLVHPLPACPAGCLAPDHRLHSRALEGIQHTGNSFRNQLKRVYLYTRIRVLKSGGGGANSTLSPPPHQVHIHFNHDALGFRDYHVVGPLLWIWVSVQRGQRLRPHARISSLTRPLHSYSMPLATPTPTPTAILAAAATPTPTARSKRPPIGPLAAGAAGAVIGTLAVGVVIFYYLNGGVWRKTSSVPKKNLKATHRTGNVFVSSAQHDPLMDDGPAELAGASTTQKLSQPAAAVADPSKDTPTTDTVGKTGAPAAEAK